MKKNNSIPVLLNLHTANTKQTWTWFMVMDGARYFQNVWGKPIAPTLNRWRRLRRLLMQQEVRDEPYMTSTRQMEIAVALLYAGDDELSGEASDEQDKTR